MINNETYFGGLLIFYVLVTFEHFKMLVELVDAQ